MYRKEKGGNSSVNSATGFFGSNCEETNSKLRNLSPYILGFCSLGSFIVTKLLLVISHPRQKRSGRA